MTICPLTPCFYASLRGHFQHHNRDYQEDDVWKPGAQDRRKTARHGEDGGNLLEEYERKRQSHANEDMHANPSCGFPARHTHPQQRHYQDAHRIGQTFMLFYLIVSQQRRPSHFFLFDKMS